MSWALAAILSLALPPGAASADDPPPLVGQRIAPFELFDLQGQRLRLREVREPVVVLNLFAFWCNTWIAELPQLRELAGDRQALGFRLLSISVDGKWTDQLAVVCGDDPPPWPVLVDRESRLSRQLGLRRIPTLLVLNRERRVTAAFEAYPGNPALLEAIRAAGSATADAPRGHG